MIDLQRKHCKKISAFVVGSSGVNNSVGVTTLDAGEAELKMLATDA